MIGRCAVRLSATQRRCEVIDVQFDDPHAGKVLVGMVATGLCHADDHVAVGDIPLGTLPFYGGHKGRVLCARSDLP